MDSMSFSISERRRMVDSTVGISLARITSLNTPLSIPTDEPTTPAPTYAASAISNRPWSVPSSPKVPCRTGKYTSTSVSFSSLEPRNTYTPASDGSGETITGFSPSVLPCSNAPITSPPLNHLPACVTPICVTSYLAGSSTESTDRADMSETSCSPERPPKRTATLSLRGAVISPLTHQFDLEFQFDAKLLGDGILSQEDQGANIAGLCLAVVYEKVSMQRADFGVAD